MCTTGRSFVARKQERGPGLGHGRSLGICCRVCARTVSRRRAETHKRLGKRERDTPTRSAFNNKSAANTEESGGLYPILAPKNLLTPHENVNFFCALFSGTSAYYNATYSRDTSGFESPCIVVPAQQPNSTYIWRIAFCRCR